MHQPTAGKILVMSIPYPRLLKVALQEIDLYMTTYESIYIISQFEISSSEGKFKNVVFNSRRPVLEQVLRVYEYLRRFGFFYKNKHYFHFETNKLGTAKKCDKNYRNFEIWRYVVFLTFTRLGSNRLLLKILRKVLVLFSAILFIKLGGFLRSLRKFDYIHFCQSGPQDTILSFLVSRQRVETILFCSVSTDECMNGFLLFEKYTSVVLQGPLETRLYTKLHRRQSDNEVIHRKPSLPRLQDRMKKNVILIAGASSMFYPACEELRVVRIIYDFVARNFPDKKIVYRPFLDDLKSDETFSAFFEGRPITIRPPSRLLTGIQCYDKIATDVLWEDQREYLELLRAADLVISAFQTSLLLDAVFYGAKVCSFVIDRTGYSERVGLRCYTGFKLFEGVPLYTDEKSLLDGLQLYPLIENNLLMDNWSSWWLPSTLNSLWSENSRTGHT